jgi:hypothetical protein
MIAHDVGTGAPQNWQVFVWSALFMNQTLPRRGNVSTPFVGSRGRGTHQEYPRDARFTARDTLASSKLWNMVDPLIPLQMWQAATKSPSPQLHVNENGFMWSHSSRSRTLRPPRNCRPPNNCSQYRQRSCWRARISACTATVGLRRRGSPMDIRLTCVASPSNGASQQASSPAITRAYALHLLHLALIRCVAPYRPTCAFIVLPSPGRNRIAHTARASDSGSRQTFDRSWRPGASGAMPGVTRMSRRVAACSLACRSRDPRAASGLVLPCLRTHVLPGTQ